MKTFLITSLSLLVVFLLVTSFLHVRSRSLITSIREARDKEHAVATKLERIGLVEAQAKDLETKLTTFEQNLPSATDLPEIIRDLSSDVELVSLTNTGTPAASATPRMGKELGLRVTVSAASQKDITTLITALEKNDALFFVQRVQFEFEDKALPVTATIDVIGVVQP